MADPLRTARTCPTLIATVNVEVVVAVDLVEDVVRVLARLLDLYAKLGPCDGRER